MSYKIRIPTTNSDTVSRFAITAGTPDQVVEFPNNGGTVALTSQISGGDDLLNITASFALTASYALNANGGGGLEGTNYVYVTANGTDVENAAELQTSYNTAKTLSPSATNRITIVAGPGKYNFGSTIFTMDTQYIDLVSLDGNRSVVFNATYNGSNPDYGSISITANNVFVKGVDVGTKLFRIATNLNLIKIENCKGGEASFGGWWDEVSPPVVSGTFIDCDGGQYAFGGSGATASGTFVNCTGAADSYGESGTASGLFTNCISTTRSFGARGSANGTFTNCIGGENSFGNAVGGTLTGRLFYCRLTSGTFKTVSGGGRTYYSIDGNGDTNNQ